MVNWWFGPGGLDSWGLFYERDCYLGVPGFESQTINLCLDLLVALKNIEQRYKFQEGYKLSGSVQPFFIGWFPSFGNDYFRGGVYHHPRRNQHVWKVKHATEKAPTWKGWPGPAKSIQRIAVEFTYRTFCWKFSFTWSIFHCEMFIY